MLMLDRRMLLRAGSAAVGAAALAPNVPALAHARQAAERPQLGFYRFKLRTIEITVNTGDKLVLIDAGCGVDKFQKTTGRLLGNLAAAGYAPGDIDTILFTHFHFDHLWGISDHENASLLFPSAEFVATETEFAFWSAPDLADRLPPAQQPQITQANLKLARPRLRLIRAVAEVVPGVTTFGTPGHTPGHMSVNISSGGKELLLTGDLVVNSEA